jgi:hypothetical protein
MIDHNDANGLYGVGEWTSGAQEVARFREDLYLRIIGTAETMARILDGRAETVLSNRRKAAADGNLHEDREAAEISQSPENNSNLRDEKITGKVG